VRSLDISSAKDSVPILSERILVSPFELFEDVFHTHARHDEAQCSCVYNKFQAFEADEATLPAGDATIGFSRLHRRSHSVAEHQAEKLVEQAPRKRKADDVDSENKRRKTKWNVEPHLSQMRSALHKVRVHRLTTTEVSRETGIPARTLRRYVNFSKNPADKLFYIEEPVECNQDSDDCDDSYEEVVSWKPTTTVPMFKLPARNLDDSACKSSFAKHVVGMHQPIPFKPIEMSIFDNQLNEENMIASNNDIIDGPEFDELFDLFTSDKLFSGLNDDQDI